MRNGREQVQEGGGMKRHIRQKPLRAKRKLGIRDMGNSNPTYNAIRDGGKKKEKKGNAN